MNESILFYKYLPIIIRTIAILGAIVAGYLVYSGLSNQLERQHFRMRFKDSFYKQQVKFKEQAENGKTEELLKNAGYPLGLNGLRWEFAKWLLFVFVFINYVVYPYFSAGSVTNFSILMIMAGMIFLSPTFPYSLTRFLLNRLIDHKQAKRNSELFSFYDMLLSEIQMMQQTRVNVYSLIRTLKPYFKELEGTITRLLANWTSDEGPEYALDVFAKEIGTNEAKSLANVLKSFDNNKRETILQSLQGMEDMFINSQIENYRRKRKLYVDLANIPIKTAHGLIILNFIVVIVYMVSFLLDNSTL